MGCIAPVALVRLSTTSPQFNLLFFPLFNAFTIDKNEPTELLGFMKEHFGSVGPEGFKGLQIDQAYARIVSKI